MSDKPQTYGDLLPRLTALADEQIEQRREIEARWGVAASFGPMRYGVSLPEMLAETQRHINRTWRRIMFNAERRTFRQRFIKRFNPGSTKRYRSRVPRLGA